MFCIIVDALLIALIMGLKYQRTRMLKKLSVDTLKAKEEGVTVGTVRRRMKSGPTATDASEKEGVEAANALLKWYQKAFETSSGLSNSGEFPQMDFEFENLGYKLPDGKIILKGVTGKIQSKRLTAVMGPSGAGKTTFLNVLMGKIQRTYGTLLVNGKASEISAFKKTIGYVPQDDIMLRELSVLEVISHSAKIRLPAGWLSTEVSEYVNTVIDVLGLSHVEHTLIGDETTRGISGGQRKRVNIGIELAAAPLALFADEPTSGLDSTAALTVANLLKSIARLGVNCVAVLHQPRYEIFSAFDDLLLLAPGGQTVYLGPQKDVVRYFKELGFEFAPLQNPADVLMDILSGTGVNKKVNLSPADLVKEWEKRGLGGTNDSRNGASTKNTEEAEPGIEIESKQVSIRVDKTILPNEVESNSPQPSLDDKRGPEIIYSSQQLHQLKSMRQTASFLYQAWLCHNRSLLQQFRALNSLWLEVGVSLLAGALMGLATMGVDGEMFRGIYVFPMTLVSPAPLAWIVPLLGLLIGMAVGLAGAPAGTKIFGEEKTIFWREAASGHNKLAYYLGKIVSVVYRFSLTSLHFAAIFYFLARPIITFPKVFAIILINFYCVYGLASIISTLVRRENASLLAVVACLFAATFCGFGPTLTNAQEWGVAFIWEISYSKWTAEAMYSEELMAFEGVYDIEFSRETYGYKLDQFGFDLAMAAVIGTVMRIVTYVLLVTTHRDKQK